MSRKKQASLEVMEPVVPELQPETQPQVPPPAEPQGASGIQTPMEVRIVLATGLREGRTSVSQEFEFGAPVGIEDFTEMLTATNLIIARIGGLVQKIDKKNMRLVPLSSFIEIQTEVKGVVEQPPR